MGEEKTGLLAAGRSRASQDNLFASGGGRTISLPGLLVTGDGCLDQLGESLRQSGVAQGQVLVVADSVLRELGLVSCIERILSDAGYKPRVHAQIAGEPDLAGAESVVAAVRAADHRAVIGVGGGSALDPAKLAAGLAPNDGPVIEYLRGRQLERDSLPLALIPTTAGTGAEASKNTIVTHEGRKFVISSPFLCPAVALLDPLLTLSCPPAVTAATGMDALAHAVEATLSTWATPFTTLNALSATRTLARWLPVVHGDGANLEARRAMLYAAHLAGLAINASTLLGHSIAYTIATRAHLPHGVTTAMALPYCVAYDAPGAGPQLAMVAAEMEVEPASLASHLAGLAGRMGMPGSLREVGIDASQVPAMVEQCLTTYPRPNNPVPFDRERLHALLLRLLEGDIEGATGDNPL